MDSGWTLGERWVDSGWTLGGRWVDSGWTVPRKTVTEGERDGHGRWMGWSRKVDGKRSKTKDLLYLNIYHLQNLVPISDIF